MVHRKRPSLKANLRDGLDLTVFYILVYCLLYTYFLACFTLSLLHALHLLFRHDPELQQRIADDNSQKRIHHGSNR